MKKQAETKASFLRRDALFLLLASAFIVRFLLSGHPGYGFDTGVYMGWAKSAVELGLPQSYSEQVGGNMLPDYPPLSISIFHAAGHLYRVFISPVLDVYAHEFLVFIKMPAIFIDLVIMAVLYAVVRRWKSDREALIAALVYGFAPAAIFESAVWGQTDAIYTFFLIMAVAAWAYGHRDISAAMLAFSVLTKIQAIALFPLFAFLLWRKPKALLRFTVVGIVATLIVLTPFIAGDAIEGVLRVYFKAVGAYGNISIGAYNFWWALMADKSWQMQDTDLLFNTITFKDAGILLCASAYLFIFAIFRDVLKKNGKPEAYFFCATLLAFAFFLFLPEMHERYLFPIVGLGVPLIFINRRVAWYYFIATFGFFINLMGILPVTAIDKGLYAQFDSFDGFIAVTQVWMFILMLAEAYRMYAPRPFIRFPLKIVRAGTVIN